MSTNHNRIRVADLETNQPNKILRTNLNGELEFSDVNNLQTESYNALDCTTEGKSLDARQGKILKDMIDLKPVDLASDTETQITTVVSEDKKVVSRLKLFNWWQWLKSQTQTISGAWNFTNKVTLAAGTSTTPALVIPNGTLTATTQNGALERDSKGILYTTSSVDGRQKIVTENNTITLLTKFSSTKSDSKNSISSQSERIITTFTTGIIPSNFLGRLNISVDYSMDWPYTGVQPTSLKIEYFLKIVNGFYSSSVWGSNNLGQYFLFKSINLLGSQAMNTTYTDELTTAIRANYNNLGNNGNRCGIGIGNTFLNTRKNDNSDNELPANCQFQIIERTTWQYDDANNDRLSNAYRRVISGINAFYIEKVI